jgi:hypothetical protein
MSVADISVSNVVGVMKRLPSLGSEQETNPPPTPPKGRRAKIVQTLNIHVCIFVLNDLLFIYLSLFLLYFSIASLTILPSPWEGLGVGFYR